MENEDRLARLKAEVRGAFASNARESHRVAETLYPPEDLTDLPPRALGKRKIAPT